MLKAAGSRIQPPPSELISALKVRVQSTCNPHLVRKPIIFGKDVFL